MQAVRGKKAKKKKKVEIQVNDLGTILSFPSGIRLSSVAEHGGEVTPQRLPSGRSGAMGREVGGWLLTTCSHFSGIFLLFYSSWSPARTGCGFTGKAFDLLGSL